MKKFIEIHQRIIILLILGFVFVVSASNAWQESAIFDETAHIPAGYASLRFNDMRLNPEHPPLIKNLSAIPLLFMNLNFDRSQPFWTQEINGQWAAGKSFLYQVGNDPDLILFWSRLPIILLSLLLGWFIFRWTKELAGTVAGIFALVLYAFDPNILGHNHFVTTDLGIAAFMTFSCYYFLQAVKKPSWKNVALAGIFLGLMNLAKFSSVIILPIFALVLIVYPLIKQGREEKTLWSTRLKNLGEYLGKGLVAFVISMVVVWGVYFINTVRLPQEKLAETIEYYFDAESPKHRHVKTNQILLALNENSLTRPLSEYFLGVSMVFVRVAGGNGAYFMGEVSSQAFPAYFPTVFAIKEPLPSLFLMLSAMLLAIGGVFHSLLGHPRHLLRRLFSFILYNLRVNTAAVTMTIFIGLYAYISITGNLNIGFRHLFPILPFAYILTAKVLFKTLEKEKNHHNHFTIGPAIFSLSLFLILGTLLAYPYYMSYFNPVAGGSRLGYRYVTDSNADWGQDLKRLKVFLEQHPEIRNIRVDYFGGGNMPYYLGNRYLSWWDSKRPIETGWYAVSTNFLQGSIHEKSKRDEESYRWLKNKKPDYQVGTSILIYYVSPEEVKNIENF